MQPQNTEHQPIKPRRDSCRGLRAVGLNLLGEPTELGFTRKRTDEKRRDEKKEELYFSPTAKLSSSI